MRILFGLCELCELCEFVRILYTVRILFELCELCANYAKSCSNFRTQKEQNKEQGHVRFFCANFMFILKEQNNHVYRAPVIQRSQVGNLSLSLSLSLSFSLGIRGDKEANKLQKIELISLGSINPSWPQRSGMASLNRHLFIS